MRREKGVAVAVVMLMILLIVGMSVAVGVLTRQNYTTGSFREKLLHTNYAVKAGISTAMNELTKDPTWAPTKASPYQEFLDPDNHVGFQVWVDTTNENGSTPKATSEGFDLQPGQVALGVQGLIEGQVVTGGYGGTESRIVMERPDVEFDHAIFKQSSGELRIKSTDGKILSFNSDASVAPFTGFPATPPAANQKASIRSLGNVTLINTSLNGEAILPTDSSINTAAGANYLTEQRVDEAYLPRRFASADSHSGSIPNSGIIPPGDYNGANLPDNASVSLVRGGTYSFSNLFTVGDNVTIDLVGPAVDGPVKIFAHGMQVGSGCHINIGPGIPKPAELQFYGVPVDGCNLVLYSLGDFTEAAMVISHENLRLHLRDNVKLYGAANGLQELELGSNVEIHYDEALRGKTFPVKTEWVLVSHGMR